MVPRQNREPPMGAHTRLCYSARAGIRVASHDPLWNDSRCDIFLWSFLGYLPISYQKINLLGPYVVELPPDVVWKITFEEQVTGINMNRLQEVVNKRLYLIVPVMTLIVWWGTYVIHVGSERYPTLNVGQVINLMIMDGDIMWCNRSPGAHEPPVQVLDL